MTLWHDPDFLRKVLLIDAATCLATGLALVFGADAIAGLTQLPRALLLSAGASLLPVAAFIAFVATRSPLWRPGVWLVIIGNTAWIAASLWLAFGAGIAANGLGVGLVLVQAAAVGVLTELEFIGIRRATTSA